MKVGFVESKSLTVDHLYNVRLEVSDLELMNKLLETCALLVQASAKDVARYESCLLVSLILNAN